jgi:hypothetical protein
MRNTADVTGGKPIAARLQSISGASAISFSRLLRHPWSKERGAILVPDTTRDTIQITMLAAHQNILDKD